MGKVLLLFIVALFMIGGHAFASEKSNHLEKRCGIENCHGLDIICGMNIPETCTAMYKFGDRCRQYARCEIVDGECMLIKDKRFKECQLCVQTCQKTIQDDVVRAFECESKCGLQKQQINED